MNQTLLLPRVKSTLTFLFLCFCSLCAATVGCKSQGTPATIELYPAPVPSEGTSRDKASDSSIPALPPPAQIEKLEEALGSLQSVPAPVRPHP